MFTIATLVFCAEIIEANTHSLSISSSAKPVFFPKQIKLSERLSELIKIRGGSNVFHVTDVDSFDEQLEHAGDKVVVVDFTASWYVIDLFALFDTYNYA